MGMFHDYDGGEVFSADLCELDISYDVRLHGFVQWSKIYKKAT